MLKILFGAFVRVAIKSLMYVAIVDFSLMAIGGLVWLNIWFWKAMFHACF